jgi:hypothetical protein
MTGNIAPILATAAYGLILLGTLALAIRNRTNWTHPIVLITGWQVVFIFFDAVYTILTGVYGPGEFNRYLLDPNVATLAIVGWALLYLATMTSFGVLSVGSSSDASENGSLALRLPVGSSDEKVWRIALGCTLPLAFLISVATIVFIARSNAASMYDVWANRNLIFSDGGGVLLIGTQVFRYALLVWLALRWRAGASTAKGVFYSLVLVALLLELALNSRSSVVFGFFLPLLVVYDRYASALSVKKILVVAFAVLILFGVGYRTIARDQFFETNQGLSLPQLLVQNVTDLPSFFWGGFEAASLDGTIDILDKYRHTRLSGETLFNAMSAPVPRPLWEEKPRGGANTEYTEAYYPSVYGAVRTEYSASLAGELYMNFGFAGMVLGGVLLGIWLRMLKSLHDSGSVFALVVYGVAIGRTFSMLRGDAFNFVGQLFSSLLALFVVLTLAWMLRALMLSFAVRRRRYPTMVGHFVELGLPKTRLVETPVERFPDT